MNNVQSTEQDGTWNIRKTGRVLVCWTPEVNAHTPRNRWEPDLLEVFLETQWGTLKMVTPHCYSTPL